MPESLVAGNWISCINPVMNQVISVLVMNRSVGMCIKVCL